MNKVLKIGGIVLGGFVFIVIVFIATNASKSMLSGTSTSFSGEDSMGMQSTGISSSLSMGSSRAEKAINAVTVPAYEADNSQNIAQTDKKIIKNGDLTLKVDSTDKAAQKIAEIAKKNSGEVSSSSFYQSASNMKTGSMSVKTPVANFDKTFAEIKSVASLVVRESTSGQDVTEQYIDLQAQLKNKQAEEQSFVKILDQAQKIQDILDVTAQLARVRGGIEQLQGRIKYLESQTDMSTISISLSEDANITVIDSWRPWQVVKDSFNSLVKGLQGFIDLVIQFIVVLLPFLIIWAVIIWAIYRVGKKIYLRIKNKENNTLQ